MPRPGGTPLSRAIATALGGLVGGGLMCGIGLTHGSDTSLGAVAGAVLGGALGRGVETGTTSGLAFRTRESAGLWADKPRRRFGVGRV
jgi:hypothetical protein